MTRLLCSLLVITMGASCAVNVRPPDTDHPSSNDGGHRPDGGAPNQDAGQADAGDVDAGESDGGPSDAGSDGGTPYPRRWGNPQLVAGLDNGSSQWTPTLSDDALRLCFCSDRSGGMGKTDIWCASRASVNDAFGAAVNQANINSTTWDERPFIWRDELYFTSARSGANDIFRAKWNALAGAYSSPVPVAELNTAEWDTSPTLTADGLTIYFESGRGGGAGKLDVYVATRTSVTGPFETPINIAAINSDKDEFGASPAPDDSFLMFKSTRPAGATGHGWWMAEANPGGGWKAAVPLDVRVPSGFVIDTVRPLPDGSLLSSSSVNGGLGHVYIIPPREPDPPAKYQWGTPVPITELNTPATEAHPTMTADQLRLCFTSNRAGTVGSWDIWCATRASVDAPFGLPTNQSAINSSASDHGPALSSDGTELFFQSQRSGSDKIYRAVWVPADNTFKFPELVTPLNSNAGEGAPALTNSDLTIVFDSNRGGGVGGVDLYVATRPSRSAPFGAPTLLTTLSSTFLDAEPAPTADGFQLLFASKRPTPLEQGEQSYRIWAADLMNGQWSAPELVVFDNFANENCSGPAPLADGSLIFHCEASGNHDLYIAPPKPKQ
jgi:Tol biopolymer transport system component